MVLQIIKQMGKKEKTFIEIYNYLELRGYNVVGATIDELYLMKQHDNNMKRISKK